MKRVWKFLVLLGLLMVVALPALAQADGDSGGTGEAINVTATVAAVSLGISWVVEWIRGRFPSMDGDVVRGLAFVLGLGAALAWDLRIASDYGYAGLPDLLDLGASALVISGLSGYIGSAKNANRAMDPQSTIYEEAAAGEDASPPL